MIVAHTRVISCTDTGQCSDDFLTRLGHGAGKKLKADNDTDTVHGSITIVHNQPPAAHDITVEFYDTAESPTSGHDTTLAVTSPMPTEADVHTDLDSP